jgi:hypothetical protein
VTLVVAVAATGAFVFLCLVIALARGRRQDEDARFRRAARLTSQWSQEQRAHDAAAADGSEIRLDPVERGVDADEPVDSR